MLPSHETPVSDDRLPQDSQPDLKQNSECSLENGFGEPRGKDQGRLTIRRIDGLRPHSSYARLGLSVPLSKLNTLIEQGDYALLVPLMITCDGIIIDGYARLELARHQRRSTLPCLEYDLSKAEALEWILRTHHRSTGLSAFNRIILALDLESLFQEKARSNQRRGGQFKGSSNLTKAEKMDVRREIATAAGVSVGNVSKVKHLKATAHAELLDALRSGEISIHRAWRWSQSASEEQKDALREHRAERGIKKTIRHLVSRHRAKKAPAQTGFDLVAAQLAALLPDQMNSVKVGVIKNAGKAISIHSKCLYVKQTTAKTTFGRCSQCLGPCGGRAVVRENFNKVAACRTPALGAEVYASGSEEREFCHPCRSRSCPSCGHRATILWQREQWAALPDIPYRGVVLTMPKVLWPIFQGEPASSS